MDYTKGKIYVIKNKEDDEIYIGSTIQTLKERLRGHKRDYKKWVSGKYHYVSSFDILEKKDFYIELLYNFSCNSKKELEKQEGIEILNNKCVNKRVAGRCKEDYMKIYRSENKEHIAVYNKNRRLHNENHKKILKKADKTFYDKNKEKMAIKKYCDCGGRWTYKSKKRHEGSKKHIKWLNEKKKIDYV